MDSDGGEETLQMIVQEGGDAICFRADVSEAAEVQDLVAKGVAHYGRIDCAFNNAGIEGMTAPVIDCSEELWNRVIRVNLTGVWLCMKYELRQMLEQGHGTIVNNASIMGLVSTPINPAYSASKHGVVGLTKSAALAYAEAGIRVNAVCPAFVQSPMIERHFKRHPERREPVLERHPMGRLAMPQEIAAAVIWLCSDAASFVTGHALPVDGGYVAQ